MILVTGGAFQGKYEFAKERFDLEKSKIVEGKGAALEELWTASMILHFHDWIKEQLKQEQDMTKQVMELLEKNPDVIIEMNQIGCGVVPMDSFERAYREKVGRIGMQLAKEADEVYVVTCGIGTRIK